MKYLTTILLSTLASTLLAFAPGVRGQTTTALTILNSFPSTLILNGANPSAGLVQGSDGNFYGTTYYGGGSGYGTVFQITPAGVLTTLHSFADVETEGAYPTAGLVQGRDGNFYGTTSAGGIDNGGGYGTVFQITPAGVFTALHSFTGTGTDGKNSYAGVVQGSDGNFYGTTSTGGSSNDGTVYRITPAGVLTTIHSFTNTGTDGAGPVAGLVQGSDGNFYGTTVGGGSGSNGTVYRITPAGVLTTLHRFTGQPTDGAYAVAGLVQGSDGNFYGTTEAGGTNGDGTVYRITPAGVLTTLYSFSALDNDVVNANGGYPSAVLVQGSDGNFYGTTQGNSNEGGNDAGTVFQITPAGVLTTLHRFTGQNREGAAPEAGLVQGNDGNFYGTTYSGGSDGFGTVFRLSLTPSPGTLQFAAASYTTTENAGSITLTVQRNAGATGAVSVDYSETDGTALAGVDYQAMGGILTWADGDDADKTITIPIDDRGIYNGSFVSFSVHFANATGGVILGTPSTATVDIVEAVTATPAVTLRSVGDGTAVEGVQKGKVLVTRTGDTTTALLVYFRTKGSAKPGVDYKPVADVVTIPVGATQAKIKIKPIDEATADGTRKVKVKLLPVSDGSYTVGDPAIAKITVIDNG